MNRLISLIFVFLTSILAGLNVHAQDDESDDYYEENTLRFENRIYHDDIHSAFLYQSTNELSDPILELGGKGYLFLTFDDLSGELNTYYYELIHCTKDWERSDMFVGEFVDGLPDNIINDFEYSRNPLQKFVNYQVNIPNEDMRPKLSGNYIIHIYKDGDREQTVLTKRFCVIENLVSIKANVRPATRAADQPYQQEVDFSIQHPSYNMTDPFQNVHIALLQNNNWTTGKFDLKPLFVKDRELDYDYEEETTFWAGNEFRNFDIQAAKYRTEFVKDFYIKKGEYHVDLFQEKKRAYKVYVDRPDINGKTVLSVKNMGFNEQADGEYVWVHFKLAMDEVQNGDIYIGGELFDWRFNAKNKMNYDSELKIYHANLYLKQGYYNYNYYQIKDGNEAPTLRYTEGSHAITENNYSIIVYHSGITDNYDRIVGYKKVNSRNRIVK